MDPKNAHQAAVDATVKAVKARQRIIGWAARGCDAPETLRAEEIKSICEFAIEHADCWETSKSK